MSRSKHAKKEHVKTHRKWFQFHKKEHVKPDKEPVKHGKEHVKTHRKWFQFRKKGHAKPDDKESKHDNKKPVKTGGWFQFHEKESAKSDHKEPAKTHQKWFQFNKEKGLPKRDDRNANHSDVELRLDQLEKYSVKNIEATNKFISSSKELLDQLKGDMSEVKKENRIFHSRHKRKKEKPIPELEETQETRQEVGPEDMEAVPAVEKKEDIKPEEIIDASYGAGKKIETSLDMLYDLVSNKGRIGISEAAKAMHTNTVQIEEWARILETHNLVEIHYPAVGKPLLRLKK